ncbi:MAG: MBL fold metallo-hydrolase [Candidatus Liptonbacteria bacterium]|nr:MBL fold metallo-hydrolase [Candidatus Liptonbacteria bacterium]
MRPSDNKSLILVLLLLAANVALGLRIGGPGRGGPSLAFLDVGQGDASLVTLPLGGRVVQILIDGGPNAAILPALEAVMPDGDRSIDLVMLTHPQLDHFGGLIDVVKRYRVGAFIWNGRAGTVDAWDDLVQAVRGAGVPALVLGSGDAIRVGDHALAVLHPDRLGLVSGELNDSSLVMRLDTDGVRALFTGDIASNIERRLPPGELIADILKVPHHGSKYSSGKEFLERVGPKAAFIEVGKNTYGHPTSDALARLAAIGSRIFRTDRDGTVVVRWENGKLQVLPSKRQE